MIPYDADPSLHPSQPAPPQLDDGFSPPPGQDDKPARPAAWDQEDPALWSKSEF